MGYSSSCFRRALHAGARGRRGDAALPDLAVPCGGRGFAHHREVWRAQLSAAAS